MERLLFIGLVMIANDYGKERAHPSFIKSKVFPYDSRTTLETIAKGLRNLQNEGMIGLYETLGSHWFIILNWQEYQHPDHPGKDLIPNPSDKDRESFANRSRGLRDTLARIDVVEVVVEGEGEVTTREARDGFQAFWKTYPKKIGKGAAEKAWSKIKPNQELKEKILTAVCLQLESEQWRKDNGQYIPHPATWLNQKRWEDEIQKGEETWMNRAIDEAKAKLAKKSGENKSSDSKKSSPMLETTL